MRNPNLAALRLTQQQRFLIKTPTDRPKIYKSGQLLTEGTDYTMLHDTLTYHYGGGEINDSSKCWVFKSLNSAKLPSGTVVSANYDYVDWNNYITTDGPRYNYCPSESATRALVKTEDSLTVHRLAPIFMDHVYNEPTQGTIKGDSRCTKTDSSPARLLADDIVFNLTQSQSGSTIQTKILLSADALVPQHNGKAYDSIWQAIKIIKDEHPSYPAKITPWIWGFNDTSGTIDIPYQEFKDSIWAAVDTFNHYGYEPIFAYFRGSRELCLKWLRAYKERPHADSLTGFTIHPDAWEAVWDTRPEFQMIPFGLEYAWNWRFINEFDTSNSALYGDYPNSENRITSWQFHKNYGDVFSPIPANFKAQAFDSNGQVMVKLTWSPNLNKDWGSYRIEKYDWPNKKKNNCIDSWHPLPLITGRLDTLYTDTNPIWGWDGMCKSWLTIDAETYARYRISAYDSMANQSPFDLAESSWRWFPLKSYPGGTGYSGQTKIKDPWGIFRLTYFGGIIDTVVLSQKLILVDTIANIIDTVGIGKFPTLVLKPGTENETLGIAFLSKHSDTIFYRCRTGTVWDSPVVLYSGARFSLSVPRMTLDTSDTVHITFAKKNISGDTLTLNYGKFSLTDPAYLAVQPISRWTPTNPSGSIDSLGAAVVIDFLKRPYLAWIENNTIKYGFGTPGGFFQKVLSSTVSTKRSVCASATHFNIDVNWTDGDNLIRSYWYAGDTAEIFQDTVYSGSEPKNATAKGGFMTFEEANDVFVKLWDAVNRSWSVPETLSIDTLPATYPQIEAEQFIDSTNNTSPARFVIWTQMQEDSLYELAANIKQYENTGEYGITPYAYLKMGKANSTPFTVHRDGYHSFGSEDYKQIDFGQDSLVYLLPSLEPDGKYRIFTEFYFDTTAPNGWKAGLTVNGISIRDSITINPRQLLQINNFLPANIPAMGYLRIKLTNLQGIYVPCSRIILTKFKED
jgi:hypothetical protein